MKATQHATNSDLVAIMAQIEAEENATAREYQEGTWVELEQEYCDDFALDGDEYL